MVVETKLNFQEYLKLMYLLSYRKFAMIILTLAGLMLLADGLLHLLGLWKIRDGGPYFKLVLAIFILGFYPFAIYRAAKRNFSSSGRLQEKIVYEFTDDKMKLTGESFHSEMDWAKVYKVQELGEWILIYQSRVAANMIPKRELGGNLKAFRELVRRTGVKAKLKA